MAELFGKETGCSHGRGGSMHLFDLERRFMGGYAIVGGQLPLATGAAFAVTYRGSQEVVACQMGDGTTNTGAFHESLNLAKIYRLPIIYFVVNNQYGMGLRVEQGSAVSELYRKACAYDMRSERVDGNDVLAVRDAVRNAAQIARTQHEPSLIEAISYRFRGHSVVDPDRYRDPAEVQEGRGNDPIAAFAARLMAAGLLNEDKAREIDEQARKDVDAAVQFAAESNNPSVDGLFDFIYASDDAGGKEQ
jgi:pyruvate dehydrogenase E1 component alpha subunit